MQRLSEALASIDNTCETMQRGMIGTTIAY
jgi:hypothetical protein